ncbi:hypothetical protein G6F21_014685 [Rhizopus arrhizus]|nr:hypothetical protein G6F21_014685 [Rhizopus arrhizus]
MTERGYTVAIFPGDVSDPGSAEALVRAVEAELGPVEILVNNAGITRDARLRKMSFENCPCAAAWRTADGAAS